MRKLKIFSDGGSRGNPGPSAIGVVIFENEEIIETISKTIGEATNNIAEYTAVMEALEWVEKYAPTASIIEFFLDSELVCHQLNGLYKVRDTTLKKLHSKINDNISKLNVEVTFSHIRREMNSKADRLVNEALDGLS